MTPEDDPTRLSNSQFPDDLFDDSELFETTPGPDHDAGEPIEAAAETPVTQSRVGYCKPPVETRWKKGASSPNPNGRPPKQKGAGPLSDKMRAEIEIQIHGQPQRMSRRAALDRLVRDKAISVGGGWLTLWDARQARDQELQRRVQEQEQKEASDPYAAQYEKHRREEALGDFYLRLCDRVVPGFVETHRKLMRLGLVPSPQPPGRPK